LQLNDFFLQYFYFKKIVYANPFEIWKLWCEYYKQMKHVIFFTNFTILFGSLVGFFALTLVETNEMKLPVKDLCIRVDLKSLFLELRATLRSLKNIFVIGLEVKFCRKALKINQSVWKSVGFWKKTCVAYPQEDFLFKILHRDSWRPPKKNI
jgi:hypothetical protein